MCIGVYEAVGEAGADLGRWEERGKRGGEEVGELAKSAGRPGVDLEVGWEGGGGCGGEVGGAGELSAVEWIGWGKKGIGEENKEGATYA